MMLGLGANFFTGEKLFINAAYNFSYLSNSFYRDGIVHLLKIGLVFRVYNSSNLDNFIKFRKK